MLPVLKFVARDRVKAYLIAKGNQRHRYAIGTKKGERRSPEQTPSARHGKRVHRCLLARNRYTSGGHLLSRRLEARSGNFLRKIAQISEARGESEEIGVIQARAMLLNYFADGELVKARDFLEVQAKLEVVADGDLEGFALYSARGFGTLLMFAQARLDSGVVDESRIKRNQQGTVGGLQVAQPGRRISLERAQEFQDTFMRGQADFFAEIDEDGLIACRAKSHSAPLNCPGNRYCTKPMFPPGTFSGPSLMGPNCASKRAIFSPRARQIRLAWPGLTIMLLSSFP